MIDERPSQPREGDEPPAPDRVPWSLPIDLRSTALIVLALLASVYALHWASDVLIPLMFGLMFSYALAPVVDRLQRWHIPRALAAGVLILGLLGGIGTLIYALSDDAAELIEELPAAAQKLRQTLRSMQREPQGTMDKVQKAATQLQQAAEENRSTQAAGKGVTRVQIERPKVNVNDYLWAGTLGVFGLVGQITIVAFLTFFMLATGDGFRRKLVKIAPTFGEKRITVEALDEITRQIQRYLLVQLFVSVLVGVATWLVFLWIGVDHAGAWGVLAGVLNLVPYIGAIVFTAGAALFAFLQFGSIEMTLLVGGVSLVIHVIDGYLLAPWLTGRIARMSAVVVFAAVLAWGWLWGVWGMLLGLPILMAVKVVCDRVDDLKPIGELLGE
jgi:predicted PurR-regulated permease PerM